MNVLQELEPFQGYEGGEEMPLDGYAVLLGVFHAFLAGAYALARDGGDKNGRHTWSDVVLLGLATHKLSRIITHDWVTSPLRAPFVKYVEATGAGEVFEKARGTGLRRAFGDLVTCNWCIGPWVAAAMLGGMGAAPRFTRFVATLFTLVAISDFLHEAYGLAKYGTERLAPS